MGRFTRRNAPANLIDLEKWPELQLGHLDDAEKGRVLHLKAAIMKYIHGERVSEIQRDHGLFREELLRWFNRCLEFDRNGKQLCWRGLLRSVWRRSHDRRKPLVPSGRGGRGGLSGALTLFFKERPHIEAAFRTYLWNTGKRRVGHESLVRHFAAHGEFIRLCRQDGVAADEWPMHTQKLGRGSIHRYVAEYIQENYDAIVSTQYGEKAAARANTGTGTFTRLVPCMPFDIVELDEHRCHFLGAIALDTLGGRRWIVCPRLTIIVIADRSFGLILGWKVIFRREACGDDMLDVLHQASMGGPEDEAVRPGGTGRMAFPRDLDGLLHWIGFSQLLVDNALIHIFEEVIDRARALLGFDINYGPVGRPERRPTIEGIFSELVRRGFHRLRETTGSSPQDPVRQLEDIPPDQRIDQHQAVALIGSIFERHNRKRTKGTYGIRRIEQLKQLMDDAGLIAPALPPNLPEVPKLCASVFMLRVRGSQEKGRRPYVYFQEEEYFGDDLADRWDLIGKPVHAHLERIDARFLTLHGLDKKLIGTAKVRGRWRHSAHTVDQRLETNKLFRDGYLPLDYDEDPIVAHMDKVKEEVGARGSIPAPYRKATALAIENAGHHAKKAFVDSKQGHGHDGPASQESSRSGDQDVDVPVDDLLSMDDLRAFNGDDR